MPLPRFSRLPLPRLSRHQVKLVVVAGVGTVGNAERSAGIAQRFPQAGSFHTAAPLLKRVL